MRFPAVSFLVLLLAACSSVDYDRGFVRDVQLEPRNPAAGQRVRVVVEIYDPYFYPATDDESGPLVTLSANGGEVEGQSWHGFASGWETAMGNTVTVSPTAGMFWTLPTEAGEYELIVSFDQNSLTRKVRVD